MIRINREPTCWHPNGYLASQRYLDTGLKNITLTTGVEVLHNHASLGLHFVIFSHFWQAKIMILKVAFFISITRRVA